MSCRCHITQTNLFETPHKLDNVWGEYAVRTRLNGTACSQFFMFLSPCLFPTSFFCLDFVPSSFLFVPHFLSHSHPPPHPTLPAQFPPHLSPQSWTDKQQAAPSWHGPIDARWVPVVLPGCYERGFVWASHPRWAPRRGLITCHLAHWERLWGGLLCPLMGTPRKHIGIFWCFCFAYRNRNI